MLAVPPRHGCVHTCRAGQAVLLEATGANNRGPGGIQVGATVPSTVARYGAATYVEALTRPYCTSWCAFTHTVYLEQCSYAS